MLSLLGSIDFTSVVPATYRASTSLVLQTTFAAGAIYVVIKLLLFIRKFRRQEKLYWDLPGPKKRSLMRGSFCVVGYMYTWENFLINEKKTVKMTPLSLL